MIWDERRLVRYARKCLPVLAAGAIASCLLTVAGIASLQLPRSTTYHVVAATEAITMRLAGGVPWRWRLDRDLVRHLAPAAADAEATPAGGDGAGDPPQWTLQLGSPVDVTIARVSQGAATITVNQPSTCQKSTLFGVTDEPVAELACGFEVVIADPAGRAARGRTTALELQGQITVGRPMAFQSQGSGAGVLRSGRVRLRERSLLGRTLYDADTLELDAGDFFRVDGATDDTAGRGFVLLDERPGLTAAFTTVGTSAFVQRPGGSSTTVESGFFTRLTSDRDIGLLVTIVGGLLTLIASCAAIVEGLGERASTTPDDPSSPQGGRHRE